MKFILAHERLLQVLIILVCLPLLYLRFSTLDSQAQTLCNGSPPLQPTPQFKAWPPNKNIAVQIFEKSTGADTSDAEFNAIDDAIRDWNNIKVTGCSNVTFGTASRAGRIWDPVDPHPNDTIFVVRTTDSTGQWVGIFNSTQMIKGRAYLHSDHTLEHPQGQTRVDNLAKHEVGHSFGVANGVLGDPPSVMAQNSLTGPNGSYVITACDIDAHQRVYCPIQTPTPTPEPTILPTPIPWCTDPTFCNNDFEYCLCAEFAGYWDPIFCYCEYYSPVLIDINGDGFRLSSAEDGVSFDLSADGIPEQLGWTRQGTDDAWLVLDRNNNGTVDDGSEMFGNYTPQPEPPAGVIKNGFLALAEYDKVENGGNLDGQLSRRDSIYRNLRLWQDTNHNGISESGELKTFDEVGLRKIDLDYSESDRTDQFGNRFKFRARVRDARDAQLGRWAWDVFLVSEGISNFRGLVRADQIYSLARPKCRTNLGI